MTIAVAPVKDVCALQVVRVLAELHSCIPFAPDKHLARRWLETLEDVAVFEQQDGLQIASMELRRLDQKPGHPVGESSILYRDLRQDLKVVGGREP